MALFARWVCLVILSLQVRGVPLTVMVTVMDKYKDNDYLNLFKAGVSRLVLAENWLWSDGSIIFPKNWMTKDLAKSISGYARKFNAEVMLGVVPMPFIGNGTRSLSHFATNAQATMNNYFLDGILLEVWDENYTPRGEDWEVVNNLTSIISDELNSTRGTPAVSSIMFAGNNFTSVLWEDLHTYKPWKYTNSSYCLFDVEDVDYKTQISQEWAENVTTHLLQYAYNTSQLHFTVIPEGRYDNLTNAISYKELINDGAPVSGDGYYNGFYYNSQRQIKEKADIVRKKGLSGLAIFLPSGDLPITNKSSLQYAALHGS